MSNFVSSFIKWSMKATASETIPLALRVPREMWKEIHRARQRAETRAGIKVTVSAMVRKLLEDGLKKERRAAR